MQRLLLQHLLAWKQKAQRKPLLIDGPRQTGKRTRAKSLQSYITKCQPLKTFKLTATQGSSPVEQKHIVLPLYYAGHLADLLVVQP